MKQILLLSLLLALFFPVSAQLPTRLWMGLNGSLNYSFVSFSPATNPADVNSVDSLRSNVYFRTGGSAGFSLLYYIHEHVMLEAGIRYSNYSFGVKGDYPQIPNPGPSTVTGSADEKYFHWMGIPIAASGFLLRQDAKLRPFITAGASPEFLLRITKLREFDYGDGSRERNHLNTPWGPFQFRCSVQAGAGVFVKVFFRWRMRIEPYLTGMIEREKGESWHTTFLSPGLNLGLYKGI